MNGRSSVSIPGRVQEMIREIKEITGKHSDDDVYAMLKECNMDPNETTQRLLYLDSFHEVKKKRDRKKTVSIGGRGEQSSLTFGQGLAAKGVRGNYSSYPSRGVAGGRTMPVRKENGISSSMVKKSEISPFVPEKLVKNSSSLETKSEISPNVSEKIVQNSPSLNSTKSYKMASIGGPWNASNGLVVNEHRRGKSTGIQSTSVIDKVSLPLDNQIPDSVVLKDKVNGIVTAAVSLDSVVAENGPCNAPVEKVLPAASNALPAKVIKPNQQLSGQTTTPTPVSSKSSTMIVKGTPESVTGQTVSTQMKLAKLNMNPSQHVIFPNHILVPDTVKAGLTFGSLVINYEQTEQVIDGSFGDLKAQLVLATIPKKEDTAKETIMSNEGLSLIAQEGDLVHSESPKHVVPEVLLLQESVSNDTAVKHDHPTTLDENLLLQGAQDSLHQSEGPETQVSELSTLLSTDQQAVDVTTTDIQNSFHHVSPPPFPFYAHGTAFPPNYIPYNPYFHPFYMASSMPQFLGPTGFTQLPSTGNMYLPPAAAVSGVKLETTTTDITTTNPQGKPLTNAGKSSPPFMIPSGYGFTTNMPPVKETDDYTVSSELSKENSVYTTMSQGDRPFVYLPASGHHHPFYSGQQLMLFPGIYPAMQVPSMAGTGENGVLPLPSSYQMAAQNGINSNTNYD